MKKTEKSHGDGGEITETESLLKRERERRGERGRKGREEERD